MGIPVWILVATGIGYILWSSHKILSISARLSEMERDKKDELRRENEALRREIEELKLRKSVRENEALRNEIEELRKNHP